MFSFLRIWREERGSTALTLAWFMVAAVLFAIGLDALLGIYVTHQQLHSAASAAISAVDRAITDEVVLPEAIEEEAARRVDAVKDKAEAEIDEILDRRDCDDDEPSCEPLSRTDIKQIKIRAYRAAFEDLYGDELDRDMAEKMVDGTWADESVGVKMNELIQDDHDLACLIQDSAGDAANRDFIVSEAERLAEANGATVKEYIPPGADGWSYVVVSREVKPFGASWLFPDGDYPELSLKYRGKIVTLGGKRTIEWPC